MSGKYIMNDDGEVEQCDDLMKWAAAFEDNGNRKIGSTEVGEVHVSTIFLGLDHSFGGKTPLLFETMVFGGPLDGEQDRYSTRDEALKGHAVMVAKVEAAHGR